MTNSPALVWFDLNLRLTDNSALERAMAEPRGIVPVFVWAPDEESPWPPGGASRWWLHQSLEQLDASLRKRGSRLIVRQGPTAETLLEVASGAGATAVFWNHRYEPASIARQQELDRRLRAHGILPESCPGSLLFEPGTVLNTSGKPFQVFTAFWRSCQAMPPPARPRSAPDHIPAPSGWPATMSISGLGLEPEIDWAGGLREAWRPGERGAHRELTRFLDGAIETYPTGRDRPGQRGTSRLSPHLHFGEISPRQVWDAARRRHHAAADPYLRQIVWREFAHHVLYHFPQSPQEPLRPEFRTFPWQMDVRALKAWTRGQTGYPMVDAGMRELWHTGWMHNRVRMLAASFLVKHLLIPWQEGAAWFWDTLVDADLANNIMGWQWVAGCGADAAPYFRIFNPVIQGEKFDPEGAYVRRWIPELAALPAPWIHKPWEAPPLVLAESGVELGKMYPRPVVEHGAARERALVALSKMRGI